MRRLIGALAGLACLALPVAAQQPAVASNPHGAFPAGLDCGDCHTASGWKEMRRQSAFDHSRTRFPLTGRHATTACARCHLSLRFDEPKASEAQCTGCHADVHRGNLPGECVRCHSTSSFRDVPAVAVHARTAFPLSGAHLAAPCESCHRTERDGAYSAVARECYGCHRTSLARAGLIIDHSGFGTDCLRCHTAENWGGGAGFDHAGAARGFALLAAHARLRCSSCHVMPGNALRFSPAPAGNGDCVACHQADYQREHAGTGFPTTCADCHGQDAWGGASFDHDARFFPINSGAHRSKWQSCATCHTVPNDYRSFTCVTCHEHRQSSVDAEHREVRNYVYSSDACYSCHRNGKS